MKQGERHPTRSHGHIEVIEYLDSMNVLVRFVETDYETWTRAHLIKKGSIKDKFDKTCYGVGYLGGDKHKANDGNPAYRCWLSMLTRCYCPKYQKLRPTYIECKVVDEWLNYQVFADWYYENHPKDGEKYDLDKDTKAKGNKTYGPDFCVFITPYENAIASIKHMRTIEVVRISTGEVIQVKNQSKFCRDNNIKLSPFNNMTTGRYKESQGYKLNKPLYKMKRVEE